MTHGAEESQGGPDDEVGTGSDSGVHTQQPNHDGEAQAAEDQSHHTANETYGEANDPAGETAGGGRVLWRWGARGRQTRRERP